MRGDLRYLCFVYVILQKHIPTRVYHSTNLVSLYFVVEQHVILKIVSLDGHKSPEVVWRHRVEQTTTQGEDFTRRRQPLWLEKLKQPEKIFVYKKERI